MSFTRTLSSLLSAAALVAIACSARAQDSDRDSVVYALSSPPSRFEWGCFGGCACPISVQMPLTGRFLLRRSHTDPLFTWYDVLDVHWQAPDHAQPTTITGSGTYRLGGEFALMEELTLDLSFNGGPIQRFTSGLRQPRALFPEIHARISLYGEACFDSVLEVDAKPIGVAGVGEGSRVATLMMAPNPFQETSQIMFVLPVDGMVDLGVYDLAGRHVVAIVEHQWLTSGPYRRSWDGRGENGLKAAPGVYWVRIDTPAGRTMRRLVKLD